MKIRKFVVGVLKKLCKCFIKSQQLNFGSSAADEQIGSTSSVILKKNVYSMFNCYKIPVLRKTSKEAIYIHVNFCLSRFI